jgi:hypothetical protein
LYIIPFTALEDSCDEETLIFFLIGAHQDNFNTAPEAVAVHMVRRSTIIEHRPVAVHNLFIEELLQHLDF